MSRERPEGLGPEDLSATNHSDLPIDVGGAFLFGISHEGAPFYYDADKSRVVEGDDDGNIVEDHGIVEDIEAFITDIEERIGWDLLGGERGDDEDDGGGDGVDDESGGGGGGGGE